MHMKSAVLALFFVATAALAQPFVSPAEITPAFERSPFSTRAVPAMALARDGDGFVAAWSAGAAPSRIYAVRLNASFKAISPIREFAPYFGAAYDANYPDIVPIDGGYALVWLERERIAQPRLAIAVLARLTPAFEPSRATVVTVAADSSLARVVGGNSDSVSVLVQGNVFTVGVNGAETQTAISAAGVDDAVTRDAPIAVTTHVFHPGFTCISFCGGIPNRPATWTLDVQINHSTFSGTLSSEPSGPSIAYGGGVYVVVWFDSVNLPSGDVNAVRFRDGAQLEPFNAAPKLGSRAVNGRETRPSVAWDGERFLIVWQTRSPFDSFTYDLAGAVLTPDGHVQSFPLVTTPADERNPIVVGVMPGRFALAYETQSDAEHRQLNFRYVDFVKFRQRPSR